MKKQPPHLTEFSRQIRKNPTFTEKLMWQALRKRKQDGLKFRREYPVEGYIADFFSYVHKLVLEIDGAIHNEPEKKANDLIRQQKLENAGYRVLRFTVEEVNINIDSVIEKILITCKQQVS